MSVCFGYWSIWSTAVRYAYMLNCCALTLSYVVRGYTSAVAVTASRTNLSSACDSLLENSCFEFYCIPWEGRLFDWVNRLQRASNSHKNQIVSTQLSVCVNSCPLVFISGEFFSTPHEWQWFTCKATTFLPASAYCTSIVSRLLSSSAQTILSADCHLWTEVKRSAYNIFLIERIQFAEIWMSGNAKVL